MREQVLETGEFSRRLTQLVKRTRRVGIENTDDRLLRLARRDGGDTHVEWLVYHGETCTAILGTQPVSDVELAEYLDARHDAVECGKRHLHIGPQHTIHAKAHNTLVTAWLDVHVTGPCRN